MSDEGRLRRGLKWYNKRNRDGVLPDDITKDPGKMCDVDFYLNSIKPKAEPIKKETKPKKEK